MLSQQPARYGPELTGMLSQRPACHAPELTDVRSQRPALDFLGSNVFRARNWQGYQFLEQRN